MGIPRAKSKAEATPQSRHKVDRESDEDDFIPGTSTRKPVARGRCLHQPRPRRLDFRKASFLETLPVHLSPAVTAASPSISQAHVFISGHSYARNDLAPCVGGFELYGPGNSLGGYCLIWSRY